jgi:magnesium chelatase subunit D
VRPISAPGPPFPFSRVVGQDDAKLALVLAAVDPLIGGVLLRGQKGSAKTTLARALAGLLPGTAPFVDLPLGATEDRLIGTVDLGAALAAGEVRFTPGLLAAAHGGVLYVDEVNLLADHLVDTLLDVAVSGVNRVEREGLSHQHPARFVLIGSMNPEEGELRPQLLDRFGLCVEVAASTELAERRRAVRSRLAFDRGDGGADAGDGAADAELRDRLALARPAAVDDDVLDAAVRLALAVGAEGLRADLVLCRAAAAHAGLHARARADLGDLRRVAPLVLAHRRRRGPFDPPVLAPDELERTVDDTLGPAEGRPRDGVLPDPAHTSDPVGGGGGGDTTMAEPRAMPVGAERPPPVTLAAPPVPSARGRFVRDEAPGPGDARPVAVAATVRHRGARRRHDPAAEVGPADLRRAVRHQPPGHLLVLLVDVSGSMGAARRAKAATGTVLGLLTDAYQRRDQVAFVTVGGGGARVVLEPTSSIEVARNRVGQLATGGTTPLADGLTTALGLIRTDRTGRHPLLAVLTDGRATGTADALEQALEAARRVAAAGVAGLVLDCEDGPARLGLAGRLADAMAARHLPVTGLDPASLTTLIRTTTEELRC